MDVSDYQESTVDSPEDNQDASIVVNDSNAQSPPRRHPRSAAAIEACDKIYAARMCEDYRQDFVKMANVGASCNIV